MKDDKKENKEKLILDAAEEEFLTKGYDGARTTSIAKTAGVTHAMLHYYFRTKESLFERIVDEKFYLMSRSISTILGDPNLPIVERICSGIAAHFDFIAENPKLPMFVINEIASRPEKYKILQNKAESIAGEILKRLQDDIDKAVERSEIAYINARMLIMDILSLNFFAFITYPLVKPILGDIAADYNSFLAMRKAENIETIMCRIKK